MGMSKISNVAEISSDQNIDKDTGIDKNLLSGPHSKESLFALKEMNDKGEESTQLFLKTDSTDTELDEGMSLYLDKMAKYLRAHADNEFTHPTDKHIQNYGNDLRKRSVSVDHMAEDFLKGKPDAFGIQFLYTLKTSMEAKDQDTTRIQTYINSKKENL
jgi:hypothetical protein